MDDILDCPICGNKLRNLYMSHRYMHAIGKASSYIERTCVGGMNHSLQFFTDSENNKIDLIKVSLNPKLNRFVEVNFFSNKSRILCMKEGRDESIELPKMLELDFPDLIKLRNKIALYVVFS